MNTCVICGGTKNVALEPSRSQLIFGNLYFVTKMEYRCEKCERKVANDMVRMIEGRRQNA